MSSNQTSKKKCSKHGVVHKNGGYASCPENLTSTKKVVRNRFSAVLDKRGMLAMAELDKDLPYQISEFVFQARLHAVFSQEKLAKKIGTKQESISRLETVAHLPSLSMLQRVAKACKGYVKIEFVPITKPIKQRKAK